VIGSGVLGWRVSNQLASTGDAPERPTLKIMLTYSESDTVEVQEQDEEVSNH
jgi:hypothetical protein